MATEFKLVASDTSFFGKVVALSGDYAIVGASGLAYVFVKNGMGWAEQAKLSGSIAHESTFGDAVAIDGDYAIVGAYQSVDAQGRSYVFHRDGSNWVEESVLAPSDPVDFEEFGQGVALSGDWAMVGSSAAAYMFKRTGSTWNEQSKLPGHFSRVSLSGNYAVARDFSSYDVKVFQRNGTNWQQQAVLPVSDGISKGYFGESLSISGDYIIVGAPSPVANAAYVFARTGSVWMLQTKLEPDPSLQSLYGYSVAIGGDYAVVGDPWDLPGSSGAAYIYQRKGMAWLLAEKIIADDAAISDTFGYSVAIWNSVFGGLAIAGAISKDHQKGAAYILSDFPAVIGDLPDFSKYAIYAKILWGIMGDGGGLYWLPGKGPVPVGPDPLRTWSMLSPTKRDVLTGLALSEMANLISDGEMRQEVRTAGLKLAKQAASQLRILSEAKAP